MIEVEGPKKIAGIIVEPITGSNCRIIPSDCYMQRLRQICDEYEILLIADEVMTGFGRTGKMFACEHWNVVPDIMTLAKGLGGGVPLAALVAKENVCCFEVGDQGGTFSGNSLMMAVGIAVFRELTKPRFLGAVSKAGAHLRARLEEVSKQLGLGEIRGKGLLLALDLNKEVGPQAVEEAFNQGLLINSPRKNTLRFMPALHVKREEIDRMITRQPSPFR